VVLPKAQKARIIKQRDKLGRIVYSEPPLLDALLICYDKSGDKPLGFS